MLQKIFHCRAQPGLLLLPIGNCFVTGTHIAVAIIWQEKGQLVRRNEPHAGINEKSGNLAEGSIVVKENYTPDEELAEITLMYNVAGDNAAHHDWFFAKYLPDGTLALAPDGIAMEGRVLSCQACHSTKRDNDYLFTGPVTKVTGEE